MAKLTQKPNTYLDRGKYATRAETMEKLLALWQPARGVETLPLAHAGGRVAAADVPARNTLPVCRAAGADGVAVRYADFENGPPDYASWVENVDYAPADMGDDFDDAFDTVMWVEDFTFAPDGRIENIDLTDPVEKGQLVKPQGGALRQGELVLKKGDVIDPFRLGLLAAAGIDEVKVLAHPRVAYLPTGSELIPAGQTPQRGQNIESNSLMVSAFLQRWGADFVKLPIVADQRAALESALDEALAQADIVLLNGGTSMGTEDYTSTLLEKRASHYQHGVRCIPGIPVAVAMVDGKPVVNLPGPPYAAFCAMDWCVHALVCHWQGQPPPQRRTIKARLEKALQKPPIHEMYVRLVVQPDGQGGHTAQALPRDVRFAGAAAHWNALFIAPAGTEEWAQGEEIEAELLYTDWG